MMRRALVVEDDVPMVASTVTARGSQPLPWDRLGRSLFARNVWLLTAFVTTVLPALSTFPGDERRPMLSVAGGFVSSVAMLLVAWCGGFLLLRRAPVGPAFVAVGVMVVALAGAVRGWVLQWWLVTWGMSSPGLDGYRYRVLGAVIAVLTFTVLGAMVKTGVDNHRHRVAELHATQQSLTMVLRQAEGQAQTDQGRAIAHITSYVKEQLDQVAASSPEVVEKSLDHIAGVVVRPLSHDLAAAVPTWQPPDPSALKSTVSWSQVWADIASPAYINPLGPAVVWLIVTPQTSYALGWGWAILMHVTASALIYAGLSLLRRLPGGALPGKTAPARLAFLGLLMMLACLPAAISNWLFSPPPVKGVYALYMIVAIPAVALMFSFWGATRAQQHAMDASLQALVDQTRWWVTRARLVLWWQNGALARALHGPVQSVIHAAAQRVRVAVQSGAADPPFVRDTLAEVSSALTSAVVTERDPGRLREELTDVAAVWLPLVTIQVEVDDSSAELIDSDPVGAEITADIAAEAISKAIRHGGARVVSVTVEALEARDVLLVVADDGTGWQISPREAGENMAGYQGARVASSGGLGTAQLDTCALEWTYHRGADAGGGNRLEVRLPLVPQLAAVAPG